MSDCIVRYAKEWELSRVNELRSQVNAIHAKGEPKIFLPGLGNEMKYFIFKVFENEKSDVIVAVIDGIIRGFVTVEYINKEMSPYSKKRKYYHIVELGVDSAFRRMGVASKIIDFCKQEAKTKGFDRVELDVWEFNEDAMEFYDTVGFKTYRRYLEMDI